METPPTSQAASPGVLLKRQESVMERTISVVAPLRDEEANVIPLVEQVFAALRAEAQIELILVDDFSTDKTWERISDAHDADARVRPFRVVGQKGQSAALWIGFLQSRGSIIATLDGDLQNDPADLPRLLAELKDCDMVCGVRVKRMDGAVRRISAKVARTARKTVLGVDFRDTGCSLRVFKRWVLSTIPPFNGFHRFIPILAQRGGAIVKEIPVLHHPRVSGHSKYGILNRLSTIWDLIMVRWYCKRQLKVDRQDV